MMQDNGTISDWCISRFRVFYGMSVLEVYAGDQCLPFYNIKKKGNESIS